MKMGIVADDVTGSNDIGGMFAKAGYQADIYTYAQPGDYAPPAGQTQPDICILNTNSRLDPSAEAYRKVFAAARDLQAAGCKQFFNKTCSVFRGNIGAEFDAMLDALGMDFAVVVLGFPKNGRVTIDGVHYVHGKPLEESEFRHDPIHPMTRSDLVGILQSQTQRQVGLLTYRVVAQGVDALRTQIDASRSACGYLILDVRDQADLATIAAAVADEPVLCGSSALAEELAIVWGDPAVGLEPLSLPAHDDLGILCAAGSLMPQTAAQIDFLEQHGAYRIALDACRLFDLAEAQRELARLTEDISSHITAGRDVVFHSPNDPHAVESTRAQGVHAGLSATEVARRVSEAVAEVTARVLEGTKQNRLLVMGGETSAAVCDRLGVNGMRVWKEIQPGLPSCISLNEPRRLLVLKSGSFGQADFGVRAIEHLRSQ